MARTADLIKQVPERARQKMEHVAEPIHEAAAKAKEAIEARKPMMGSAIDKIEDNAFPIAAGLAASSIIASITLFGKRSKDTAIFVGLWAPTLLSLGMFYMLAGPGKRKKD